MIPGIFMVTNGVAGSGSDPGPPSEEILWGDEEVLMGDEEITFND